MEVIPWRNSQPATEESVKAVVRASGLPAARWEGEPNQNYLPHHHLLTKTLWCAAGDIVFHINGKDIHLRAGDKLILPAGTVHSADAGPEGVVCFESPPVHENMTVHEHDVKADK